MLNKIKKIWAQKQLRFVIESVKNKKTSLKDILLIYQKNFKQQ